MSNLEALERFKRTTKSITQSFSATVRNYAETYRDEFAYVDSLPPWKRQRYEHKTMPEIRRMMQQPAARSPGLPRERSSHGRRPGHRRTTRSPRAGPSDGDSSEPPGAALRLAPPPQAIYLFACLTPEQRGAGS
jgi:hypothetical protein